jgi:hypothetical protein
MSLLDQAKVLETEAQQVLAVLDLPTAFPSVGPPLLIGSARSGLLVLRDLDVMFDAPRATTADVLAGLATLAGRVDLLAADFRDERGDRRPTPSPTDERFYLVLRAAGWKIDLTFWLHVVERPHVAEAGRIRAATEEEKLAILQLKSTCPGYPDQVSGTDIYAAVLDRGVRTLDQLGE